ncbi:HNH endonuclease [Streptomyces halobius]|uniref:HNH endonuclease n=1 Tax=Streptomyces halobius TaxID=2879846 RepID=A0ABY4M9U9_9ACTN|nr:HNH endonuclease [Streptomyces halobius]UQA94565.1 HNH endonuclease [Streptomyces halobius]
MDDGEDTAFEEKVCRTVAYERRIRDSSVVRKVKEMYDNACQICNLRLEVSPGCEGHREAAHIQALGKPHGGPDRIGNVLCLCPTCHVLFDRGALQLTDDLKVVNGLTQRFETALTVVEERRIKVECVRQHRARWADR